MSNKTVVSLFTGAGGLDLGFVKAGFEIIFANELKSFACETYRFNFGKIHDTSYLKEGNLDNFWSDIPQHPTVLIGGPPCQSFSQAGPRTGLSSEDGKMFLKTVQNLAHVQPKYFILENVAGILNFPDGPDNPMPILLAEINKAGYECIYRT